MAREELVAARKRMRRLTLSSGLAAVVAVISWTAVSCATNSTTGSTPSYQPPGTVPADPPSTGEPTATSTKSKTKSGPAGPDDGVLPDNATPDDMSLPGIAKLDPALRKAVQRAFDDMRNQTEIEPYLTTGWRSRKYQQQLLDQAIKRYGSVRKAKQYVASPDESHHVTGKAVDVGPTDADDWLIRKGYRYGLCQTLSHEIWHFELTTEPGTKCPPPQDPDD